MCYKYATPKLEELIEYLGEQPEYTIEDYFHYYFADGFNHQFMPVTTSANNRLIEKAIWGLVPEYIEDSKQAKERADQNLNARSETIFSRPSYAPYISTQRCLAWASGFFEHHWDDAKGRSKTPYFIYSKDKQPFTFGGLYTNWVRPDTGEVFKTFSIITTEANHLLSEIHNNKQRMPLIIPESDRDTWLSNLSKEAITDLMKPLPDGLLSAHTISKLVTSRTEERNVPEVQDIYIPPKDTLF